MKKLILLAALLFVAATGYCVNQPQNVGSIKTDAPLTLWDRTSAQIIALAPDTTSQIIVCNNCVSTPVCVSTGTGVGAWVSAAVSTGATNGFGTCK